MSTTKLLLPRRCKIIGLCLLVIGITLYVIPNLSVSINDIVSIFGKNIEKSDENFGNFILHTDLLPTLIGIVLIIAGIFIGFSKNKEEDEFIDQLRYESLILSFYVNSIILIVSFLAVWGFNFLVVMEISLISSIYFYIVCFYVKLFINKRKLNHEK